MHFGVIRDRDRGDFIISFCHSIKLNAVFVGVTGRFYWGQPQALWRSRQCWLGRDIGVGGKETTLGKRQESGNGSLMGDRARKGVSVCLGLT